MDKNPRRLIFILPLALSASLSIDSRVCESVEQLEHGALYNFYRELTELGKAEVYLKAAFVLWVVFGLIACLSRDNFVRRKAREFSEYACFSLLAFALTGFITVVLKFFVGRARPTTGFACANDVFNTFSFAHVFQSFPSGHTQAVFTFALVMSARWPGIRFSAWAFALLIAGTRVVRNVHFVSDVVGGIGVALIGFWLTERLCRKHAFPSRLTQSLFTYRSVGAVGSSPESAP